MDRAERSVAGPDAGPDAGPEAGNVPGPLFAAPGMMAETVARTMSGVLRLLLPPTCLACDRLVASDGSLCAACWARMPFLSQPWCQRLGVPFAYELGPGAVSPQAIAHPPVFDRLRAVAAYDGPARALVARLKYHDRPSLAPAMGGWMARAGAELLASSPGEAAPVLVPVPLHGLRRWSRRYNQAGLLARWVGNGGGNKGSVEVAAQVLLRQRATKRQVGLDAAARARNVRGAFAVTEEGGMRLAGRRAVLVDDVYTTGATAQAAARALLRAGALSVDVLVFAHAGAETPLG